MPGSMAVVFGKPEGRGSRRVVETFNLLIAEGHDKSKRVAIYDLTYSALKVHQNTGRGEVKRNPCLEFADVLVPKERQNLCHPFGVLPTPA